MHGMLRSKENELCCLESLPSAGMLQCHQGLQNRMTTGVTVVTEKCHAIGSRAHAHFIFFNSSILQWVFHNYFSDDEWCVLLVLSSKK